jgi:hypothetical protein
VGTRRPKGKVRLCQHSTAAPVVRANAAKVVQINDRLDVIQSRALKARRFVACISRHCSSQRFRT